LQSLEKVLEDKLKKIEGRLNGELKCTILLCNYEMFDVSYCELDSCEVRKIQLPENI
jgi:hypothetical protein